MGVLIEWTDKLSLGIKEIDDRHKTLVKMINDLHQAMIVRKSNRVLGDIISGLIGYTKTHFLTEEKYFIQFDFREATAHKLLHKRFVEKVRAFDEDFRAGKMLLSMDIMEFLKGRLVEHISGADRKYAALFKENGLS